MPFFLSCTKKINYNFDTFCNFLEKHFCCVKSHFDLTSSVLHSHLNDRRKNDKGTTYKCMVFTNPFTIFHFHLIKSFDILMLGFFFASEGHSQGRPQSPILHQ